jgi:hypothetical protein
METNVVSKHDRLQKLVAAMNSCLAELDTLGAHVAGAHLDAALQALQREFSRSPKSSDTD